MSGITVGVILLAVMINAARTVRRQKKRLEEWNCTGDCDNCKTPCQVKRIYHGDVPD
nr:FeoB-associated Cys-rich membrane protein [uncultured Oscillibacter sp.]